MFLIVPLHEVCDMRALECAVEQLEEVVLGVFPFGVRVCVDFVRRTRVRMQFWRRRQSWSNTFIDDFTLFFAVFILWSLIP